MKRSSRLLITLLVAAASVSAFAATPSGRLGRELLQSGTTCANDIPHCTARRCTTRILGSKETYVCLRCKPGFIPARGIDGRSIVQCVCPPGKYLQNGACVACPKGSFCLGGDTKAKLPTDNLGGEAQECSTDPGLTTKATGASRFQDCVAEGGYVLPANSGGSPQECNGPMYAPQDNRLKTCLKCQSGLNPPPTFDGPNVDRLEVCQVPPGKFWELNVVRDCPKGLYRTGYERVTSKAAIACASCPDYWTTSSTGSVAIRQCNALVPGYQIQDQTTDDLATTAQDSATWNPTAYTVEPCPIGTYYDSAATNFKCTPCPHGSVTRQAGALSVDECMVPPGYFIATTSGTTKELKKCPESSTPGTAGYYRSGWVSYSQVISTGTTGDDVCTKCGDNILSEYAETDENPLAQSGSKVAATSASCYILAGYGITFDPTDFKLFKAMACPVNTYGVAQKTFGLINAPCKACGKNLKSAALSTQFSDCKNPAGFGYTSEGANQCPPNFWAAANSMAPCEPCPEGRETQYVPGNGDLQDNINDCRVPEGKGVYDPDSTDPWASEAEDKSSLTVRPCPVGYNSTGDMTAATAQNPTCTPCSAGQSTLEVGSTECNTCAAGYGATTPGGTCQVCPVGKYNPIPGPSCSACPETSFADAVGAVFDSYGLTFRSGLKGKETCVPKFAQQAAPTGDRLVLPAAMLTAVSTTATDGSESQIHDAVETCVTACPADQCCIAQMQLGSDDSLECKHATLAPLKPKDKDSDASTQNKARLYYKLPPSELAAASINDKTVAAKTISSGIYAVCDISTFAEAAANGQIGTSYDPTLVEAAGVEALRWDECTTDAACQRACNDISTCWGYIYVNGQFALRGGEDQLGGRTFFSSPDAGQAAGVANVVNEWITEPAAP